jgi:hypothetical protein
MTPAENASIWVCFLFALVREQFTRFGAFFLGVVSGSVGVVRLRNVLSISL